VILANWSISQWTLNAGPAVSASVVLLIERFPAAMEERRKHYSIWRNSLMLRFRYFSNYDDGRVSFIGVEGSNSRRTHKKSGPPSDNARLMKLIHVR
jgi:hypothetical protein